MSDEIRVSAPGKMMVAGEYAVLDGSPAVVVAVSRRLSVDLSPGVASEGLPHEILESLRLASAARGLDEELSLIVDAHALRQGDEKLGLGSSAAAAVATTGAVFAHSGADLDDPSIRDEVFQIANEGHRSVAPHGSGADVCASVFGGWRRFQLAGDVPLFQAISAPAALEIRVVWTGIAARTSSLLNKVRTLRSLEPRIYDRRRGAIAEATDSLIQAFSTRAGPEIIEAVAQHHEALAALGEDCGAPIVEARLSDIAELAGQHQGAAKGSGAGGGDVALGFFLDREAADAFRDACRERAFLPLDMDLGADGVRFEAR